MTIFDNIDPEKHNAPLIKAQWTGTFSDLKLLTRMGIALLRGNANPIEETAMAKMCNPGKTKHLSKEQRGFLAFESTLDRACNFLVAVDPKGLASNYSDKLFREIPRDTLINAQTFDAMIGQTALVTAYDTIQHARTIFGLLKQKFGDALKNPGTLTLEGKPKRVSKAQEVNVMQALRTLYKDDPATLGAELIKYSENPAAYKLPVIAATGEPQANAEDKEAAPLKTMSANG